MQDLNHQFANKIECEALKFVFLHEVIQANIEQFEDDALNNTDITAWFLKTTKSLTDTMLAHFFTSFYLMYFSIFS